jgi:hypothetical protein
MKKNNIVYALIFIICAILFSCSTSKNSIQIKLNDIDSAIRVVIPSHNCGCNWQERKSNLYMIPFFKEYGYSWHTIFVKSIDSVDVIKDSKKVFQELIKLDGRYNNFKRFFLEYRVPLNNDTLNYQAVGTWFHLDGYCDGYISGIAIKQLERNTAQIIDRKKLCQKPKTIKDQN